MNISLVSLLTICCAFGAAIAQWSDNSVLIPVPTGGKCPIQSCRHNEVLQRCGLCYHNTCKNNNVAICRKMCYCGCYCKTGYVRVTPNGPCILPKHCPFLDLEI